MLTDRQARHKSRAERWCFVCSGTIPSGISRRPFVRSKEPSDVSHDDVWMFWVWPRLGRVAAGADRLRPDRPRLLLRRV